MTTTELIRKELPAELVGVDEGRNTATFQVTTSARDRAGDRIDGHWELGAFRRNPIVLFQHQVSQPPVGRAVDIRENARGLISTVEFTPKEVYPFGFQVGQLVKNGFLSTRLTE